MLTRDAIPLTAVPVTRRHTFFLAAGAILVLLAGAAGYRWGRSLWHPVYCRLRGRRTVADVLDRFGPAAKARLRPHFERAGVAYPPRRLAVLAFKEERVLELWAAGEGAWAHVKTYPILAASGRVGPKLREGDRQVPEGIYRVDALNPNSSYHLSMRIDYPNTLDLEKAREEGRTDPGSDIFIHGKTLSIGCLAMGDEAIEELFCAVARIWPSQVTVVIAPRDMRRRRAPDPPPSAPAWTAGLYGAILDELSGFPPPADQ